MCVCLFLVCVCVCVCRYSHEANEALQHFNQARKDTEWGERALLCMIEICLNPEDDMLAGDTLKPSVTADRYVRMSVACMRRIADSASHPWDQSECPD